MCTFTVTTMRKLLYNIFIAVLTMCTPVLLFAQAPAQVRQGPKGIFIFTGKDIPSGKNIVSCKIERSEDSIHWKQLAELKTPVKFDAFIRALELAQPIFPSQPIPPKEKLNQLYDKAVASGNADSLKGMRLLFPIRVALGIMYYDTTAQKHVAYRYRVIPVGITGEISRKIVSDTISLPFYAKFDTITYSESSYNNKSVIVKWKSHGKNPAPLFMIYKFIFGAPAVAHGNTSRYTMNDTTYYVYRDSVTSRDAGKELQYFVSPYDHFGNSGQSSQVAVITQDNFNKATFIRNHISFEPALSGVQVCWHFSDPVTVKTVELYRSENTNNGFRKLTEVSSADTSYLDQHIWPERTYYYYIQPVAKAGKRTKQSDIMSARVPGINMPIKLNAPVLRQVGVVKGGRVRLLIEVNDTIATQLRVYRGIKGGLVALAEPLEINKDAFVAFTDSTLSAEDMKLVFYAVRNEKTGDGISGLSEEKPVGMVPIPDEVSYFYAFPSKGKVELYWDDILCRKSRYTSCAIYRQYGAENSRSPLKLVAENLSGCSFTDYEAQGGNQFTYMLRLFDKDGNGSEKSYKVTIPSSR